MTKKTGMGSIQSLKYGTFSVIRKKTVLGTVEPWKETYIWGEKVKLHCTILF